MPSETSDPHPAGPKRFVGRGVVFDMQGKRTYGTVKEASYVGRQPRGDIPDYSLTIQGRSGRTITVSLVDSHAQFADQ
jgi:hypothetical protein